MTIVELVERERAGARRLELAAGAALGVALCCGLASAAVLLLGHARWLALPRALPLIVWALLVTGVGAVAFRTRRRLQQRTSRAQIAAAIERERSLRAGALRGAIEVADTGAFGRRAAAVLGESLGPTAGPSLRSCADTPAVARSRWEPRRPSPPCCSASWRRCRATASWRCCAP